MSLSMNPHDQDDSLRDTPPTPVSSKRRKNKSENPKSIGGGYGAGSVRMAVKRYQAAARKHDAAEGKLQLAAEAVGESTLVIAVTVAANLIRMRELGQEADDEKELFSALAEIRSKSVIKQIRAWAKKAANEKGYCNGIRGANNLASAVNKLIDIAKKEEEIGPIYEANLAIRGERHLRKQSNAHRPLEKGKKEPLPQMQQASADNRR